MEPLRSKLDAATRAAASRLPDDARPHVEEDWMTDGKDPVISERKTRELCGHQHDTLRCIRSKGHSDEHAAYTMFDLVTWNIDER